MPFQLQLIINFSTGNDKACWTYIIEIVLHAINILTHFFIYAGANRLPPWGNHYPLDKNYPNRFTLIYPLQHPLERLGRGVNQRPASLSLAIFSLVLHLLLRDVLTHKDGGCPCSKLWNFRK